MVFLKVSKSFPRRYLNKKKRLHQMDPFVAAPFGGKTFSSFQNGRSSSVFCKPQTPFPIPIKWKEYSIGPLGSCFRRLPPGDKTFSSFQKGLSLPVFLKPQTPFTTPITPKLKTIGPLRRLQSSLPPGDKTNPDFKKAS